MATCRGWWTSPGQLVDKWSRLNPDDEVNVPQDMTALTLDTIALCGFDYRFNSLYRETPHPFVAAMVRNLAERQKEAKELPIQRKLRIQARRQSKEDQEFQVNLVKGLMADRRRLGDAADNTDLLGLMLTGVDKQSGHDAARRQHRRPVPHLPGRRPRDDQRAAVVRDLFPDEEPAVRAAGAGRGGRGARRRRPNPATTRSTGSSTCGRSSTKPCGCGRQRRCSPARRCRTPWSAASTPSRRTPGCQCWCRCCTGTAASGATTPRNSTPTASGPERFKAVPPNAYRPFGTGMRACIGRQFALQEATLVLGLVLQRFEFIDHRNYQLHTKSTLTVKPADFWIKLRPRTDRAAAGHHPGARRLSGDASRRTRRRPAATGHGTPLLVLFGSNLGTAEGIANRLGREGDRARLPGHRRRARRPRHRAAHAGRRADRLLLLQR